MPSILLLTSQGLRPGNNIFNPLQVGDLFENKVCNVCHRYLPTTYFDKNQNGKDNRPIRRPSCIECRIIIDGVGLSLKDKKNV